MTHTTPYKNCLFDSAIPYFHDTGLKDEPEYNSVFTTLIITMPSIAFQQTSLLNSQSSIGLQ